MSQITWPSDEENPVPVGRPPRPKMIFDGKEKEFPKHLAIQCFNCNQFGHHKRICPQSKRRLVKMRCHICNGQGHKNADCPYFIKWMFDKTYHKTTLGQLYCLKFDHKMVVEWRARSDDFTDFLGFVKKSHSHISKYCGGLLITPDWISSDRYVPKWKNEKIWVKTQSFKKISPGGYLVEDWHESASKMSVFEKHSAQVKLEKAGHRDLNHDKDVWNTYLDMFENMWKTKDWPKYVIEHDNGTMFPPGSNNDWHLSSLRRTFHPILNNVNTLIPGVNETQLLLGQIGSYTPFHVEDFNFPSVNFNHTGDIKDWIIIPAEYRHLFEKLCEKLFPESYKICKAAHMHKIFVIFPHILQTSSPPIPFHWIRQPPGKCVITYPGAYHMIINAGKNIAEAVNFADPEWTEKFSRKEILCNCVIREDIDKLVSNFNFYEPTVKEAIEGSTGEGSLQPELAPVPAEGSSVYRRGRLAPSFMPTAIAAHSSGGNQMPPRVTGSSQPQIRPSVSAPTVTRTARMNPSRANRGK